MIIPYGQWYDIIMKKLEYFFDGQSIINQGIIVKYRKLPEMGACSYSKGSETNGRRRER